MIIGIRNLIMKKYIFPEQIKSRNINTDRYYYKQDGEKMWGAIEKYVSNVLSYHYESDDINKDSELQNFLRMLKKYLNGMWDVKDLGSLIKLITSFIFNCTVEHTTMHWSQLRNLGFAPLLPTILNRPAPNFNDTKTFNFGKVVNGKLSPEQEKILLTFLPTPGQAILINSTFEPVTKPTDLPLIDDSYNMFLEGNCLGYFKDFQKEIKGISQEILNDKSRNVGNTNLNSFPYFGESSRSINF